MMQFAAGMTEGVLSASEGYATKSLCMSKIFQLFCHMAWNPKVNLNS